MLADRNLNEDPENTLSLPEGAQRFIALIDVDALAIAIGTSHGVYRKTPTLRLPTIPGGKKPIYPHTRMPITVLADFARLGLEDSRFAILDQLLWKANGLWCAAAEKYLLENY